MALRVTKSQLKKKKEIQSATLYTWNQLTSGINASIAFSLSSESNTMKEDYLASLSAGNLMSGYVNKAGLALIMVDDEHMLQEAYRAVSNQPFSSGRDKVLVMIENLILLVKTESGTIRSLFPARDIIVSEIICGDRHCGVISFSGLLYTWGWNDRGQLGLGYNCWELVANQSDSNSVTNDASSDVTLPSKGVISENTSYPLFVPHPTLVTSLATIRVRCFSAGFAHSVALTDAGIYTWGADDFGQLGIGTTPSHNEYRSIFNKSATWLMSQIPLLGRYVGVDRHNPHLVSALKAQIGFRQVSAGMYHTVALSLLGQVFTWGLGSSGQLGHADFVSHGLPHIVKRLWSKGLSVSHVSAGYYHTACVVGHRRIYTWGCNKSGQLGYATSDPIDSVPSRVRYFDDRKDSLSKVSCGKHVTAVLGSSRGNVFVFGCNPKQLLEKDSISLSGESTAVKLSKTDSRSSDDEYILTNELRLHPREIKNVQNATLVSSGLNGVFVWTSPPVEVGTTLSSNVVEEEIEEKASGSMSAGVISPEVLIEAQKRMYARKSKSLFLFSASNKFRSLCINITESGLFEAFTLLVVLFNCALLAAMDPVAPSNSTRNHVLGIGTKVITIIFAIEAFLKIISLGFLFNNGSYLRDAWNIVDFIIVIVDLVEISGVITVNISAIRATRIFRYFIAHSFIASLQIQTTTVMHALPDMSVVLMVLLFIFFVMGVFGINIWGGYFRHQCYTVLGSIVYRPPEYVTCSNSPGGVMGKGCAANQFCVLTDNNPDYGFSSFDNIGAALLILFRTITREGWVQPMYWLQNSWSPFGLFYFLFILLIGCYMLLPLIFSIMCRVYSIQMLEYREDALKSSELKKLRRRIKREDEGILSMAERLEKFRLPDFPLSYFRHPFRVNVRVFLDDIRCQCFFNIAIALNVIVLMLFNYPNGENNNMNNILSYLNIAFTVVFAFEVFILRFFALGVRDFSSDSFNWFDTIIVGLSIIDVCAPNNFGISAFRVLRLLRLTRLFTLSESLSTISTAFANITKKILSLVILLVILLFVFTVLGMQFFGGIDFSSLREDCMAKNASLVPRLNYNSFLWAFITTFSMIAPDQWNNSMFLYMRLTNQAAVIYFLLLIICGTFIFLNIFLSVILESVVYEHDRRLEENRRKFSSHLRIVGILPQATLWQLTAWLESGNVDLLIQDDVTKLVYLPSLGRLDISFDKSKVANETVNKIRSQYALDISDAKRGYSTDEEVTSSVGIFGETFSVSLVHVLQERKENENSGVKCFRRVIFEVSQWFKYIFGDDIVGVENADDPNNHVVSLKLLSSPYAVTATSAAAADINSNNKDKNFKDNSNNNNNEGKNITDNDDNNSNNKKSDNISNITGALPELVPPVRIPTHIVRVSHLVKGVTVQDSVAWLNERFSQNLLSEAGPSKEQTISPETSGSLFTAPLNISDTQRERWGYCKWKRDPQDCSLQIYFSDEELALEWIDSVLLRQSLDRERVSRADANSRAKIEDKIGGNVRVTLEKIAVTNIEEKGSDTATVSNFFGSVIQQNFLTESEQPYDDVFRSLDPFSVPSVEGKSFKIFPPGRFRQLVSSFLHHIFFEIFMISIIIFGAVIIGLSSNSSINSSSLQVINIGHYIVAVAFSVEMLLKMFAYGVFYPERHSYFRSFYQAFEFTIVVFSIAVIVTDNMVVQICYSLLPLRIITKFRGCRLILAALGATLPLICSVSVFYWIGLVICSCIGLQFWGGRLYRCSIKSPIGSISSTIGLTGFPWDPLILGYSGTVVQPEYTYATEKACSRAILKLCTNYSSIIRPSWTNDGFSYDNILAALVTSFQLSLVNSWTAIMLNCVDASETIGIGPTENNNPAQSLMFVIFVLLLSYICLNFFVAVIIENYSRMVEALNFGGALSIEQKQWVVLQRMLTRISPRPVLIVSENPILRTLFEITMNKAFEYTIMLVIVLNALIMMCRFYNAPPVADNFQDISAIIFTSIFIFEAVLKIIALGPSGYFSLNWNIFDFIICILSAISLFFSGSIGSVKVFRMLRLLKMFQLFHIPTGLRLLKTMIGAIWNILFILSIVIVVFYCYAAVGVVILGNVPINTLAPDVNFQNIINSMTVLLRMMTRDGWARIMDAISAGRNCGASSTGDLDIPCSNSILTIIYFISFQFSISVIFSSLFIAAIYESYLSVTLIEEAHVNDDVLENFQTQWTRFGNSGTPYIRYTDLKRLLLTLPPPLGLGPEATLEDAVIRVVLMKIPKHHIKIEGGLRTEAATFEEVLFALVYTCASTNLPKLPAVDKLRYNWPLCYRDEKGIGLPIKDTESVMVVVLMLQRWYRRVILSRKQKKFRRESYISGDDNNTTPSNDNKNKNDNDHDSRDNMVAKDPTANESTYGGCITM